MANRKVIYDIESRDKSGKGIQSSENALKKLSKGLASITGVGLSAASAVAALSVAAKKAVSSASDLEETTSKVNVVFGKAKDSVLSFGQTAADSLGMSENAALSAAATYGNLFRSMGMAEEKSAEMSINLVKLAGDLASFNNLDPTEVFEKLRAGLTGEAEPLKSLGVNINETVIKLRAMELGLSDGKGVLDAVTKATAAYSLIMEQTSLAQGDFARTSDGLANQQRILAANMEDLSATMGTMLMPSFIKLTGYLADTANYIDILFNRTESFLGIQQRWASQMSSQGQSYDDYLKRIISNADAMGLLHYSQEAYLNMIARGKNLPGELADKIGLLSEREYGLLEYQDKLSESTGIMATKMGHLGVDVDDVNDSIGGSGGLAENTKKVAGYFDELTAKMIYNHLAASMDAEAQMQLAMQMGLINWETYSTIQALDDLTAKYDTNGDGVIGITEKTAAYNVELSKIKGFQDAIKDKTVEYTVKTKYISTGTPSGHEDTGIGGYASGTSGLIVPPHFNHDNFTIGVKSGEKVEVTPASRVGNSEKGSGGGGNTYVFNATGITDPDQFLKFVGQKVKQQGGL